MKTITLFQPFLFAVLCLQGADAAPLLEQEIVRVVLRENPSLKSARAKWEAVKARIPQARAWDDPMIGADFERAGTTRFSTYSDIEYMASQVVPVTGKNLSAGRAAVAEATVAMEELRRAELDAVTRARVAFYRLSNGHAQLEINRRNEALLVQTAEISKAKYETGNQSQSELLLAQTDLARLAESRAVFEREIADQQSQLNVLMNRPPASPLDPPRSLEVPRHDFPAEKMERLALLHRPEVRMAVAKVDAENARLQLAQKQWIPDPQLRVEARQFKDSPRSGITEYDTGIFFSVPWGNFAKYSAGVREARRNKDSAGHLAEAARNEALGLVRDQLRKISTAAKNYELFRDKLMPLAAQAMQSTLAGYESDKSDFFAVISTRRTAQDVEATRANYLAEYHIAVAELASIIGTNPLRGDPNIESKSSK